MAAPTPVSALLHAATMVTAGLFLMIKLFNPVSSYLWVFLISGGLTVAFSSTVALVQQDVKRVVAYSTISQMGLVSLAIGAGYPDLALMRIATHAFFKATLFFCAGSSIGGSNGYQLMP